ncbi:OB-fold nucleic acid binding domain-containing protein [Mumia sp. zg.B21]|uniref:OB-fold nucleic acid binding domain-containing protein n=1 Tax=unclassified Mumia TaxID=2621872 RepID=UPI001C6E4C77|nr:MULTISPECIES: OB-fold nucleic acid binding domain-containing protein [unclassified Mumia]MBW9208722.1 OB-fold nucleic acid binding domain-containing protein [Mumia sp. zg.B21]MDD9349174.1 OB-fold nucleic acid binding domain-containing protein [Mumia sp.]
MTSTTGTLWSRARERMSGFAERADDAELRVEAVEAGCLPLCDQRAGDVVTAHGELRTVTFRPQSESRALEAVLYDGSGSLTLVWLGRKRVPGIEVGRVLTATGRLGLREGSRVIYNPRYELSR